MKIRIAGYAYKADTYCSDCIIRELSVIAERGFHGGATTEEMLDFFARFNGIDRHDEWSFDSDDFPKVIFSLDTDEEKCGRCSTDLI